MDTIQRMNHQVRKWVFPPQNLRWNNAK